MGNWRGLANLRCYKLVIHRLGYIVKDREMGLRGEENLLLKMAHHLKKILIVLALEYLIETSIVKAIVDILLDTVTE